MSIDKTTLTKLKRYAQVFKEAGEREANESDTVMYLIKFFEDVLGYDSLAGEISKEVSIKDRYCDFGIKLAGSIRLLVEAKSAGNRNLREKDIEQAENYASRSGIQWVLLTNGLEWRLYHLSFSEGEGIVHDLAFLVRLDDQLDSNAETVWSFLELLARSNVAEETLEGFWSQKKALAPASLVRVLFSEAVLSMIRREINRTAEARLDLEDVFAGVKEVLSKDALLEAGEITISRRRRKRRRSKTLEEPVQTAEGGGVQPLVHVPPTAPAPPVPPPGVGAN